MTSSKKCNNITIHNDIAYLSMEFGILTFDLNVHEFVDTYYIGPEAEEVAVYDVMLHGDSIYAQTVSSIYAAHIQDNIVGRKVYTFSELIQVISTNDYAMDAAARQKILDKFWGETSSKNSCELVFKKLGIMS